MNIMSTEQINNLRQLARQTLADTKKEVSATFDEGRADSKENLKQLSESMEAMIHEKIEDLKAAIGASTEENIEELQNKTGLLQAGLLDVTNNAKESFKSVDESMQNSSNRSRAIVASNERVHWAVNKD